MEKRLSGKFVKGIAALLAGVMLMGLFGCGKNSDSAGENRKEFYYVPQYKELKIDGDHIGSIIAGKDEIFLISSLWREETEEITSKLYRYHLLTDTVEQLPLESLGNASIQKAALDLDGNLLMIVSRYEEVKPSDSAEKTEQAEAVYESYIELWEVSATDGKTISKVDIKPVFEDAQNTYVQNMTVDNKDNIYISDGNYNIYILDKKGNKLGTIPTGENWVDSLFSSKEGNVYMRTWGNEGPELKQVNPDTKSLGEAIKSDNLKSSGYNQTYYSGIDKGILINDNVSVFSYDFASDTKEDIFEWLDSDINSEDVEMVGAMTDGRFYAILHDYSEEKAEYSLVLLTKTPASKLPEKEEVVFGALWVDQSLRKKIIDFNKANDKYHISLKTYETEDYSTGLTQFNNDITSGNGPDIMDVSNINYEQYASRGVFEDIYPYMERDGIQKQDYLENVFKAYELDGRLYAIVPQFFISTTVAKASKVSDKTGWTLSEMLDFAESSNAENVFPNGSRESVFYYCIYENIDEFIDWKTGECFFNSDDFIRVLEFANKFPEEADYNNEEGTSARLRADKLLLMQTSLSSVQEYQMYNGLFGEKVSYIGYPNSERKGNLIQSAGGSVAINAKSKHKDCAWEFIKTLISEEYQNSLVSGRGSGWGFPVKLTALDKKFEQDMTAEYYEDENGNKIEQSKTTWGYDDFDMEIFAATQEEVDAVRKIISSAERCTGSANEELVNIVREETAAFFKGQKSAKETADIIQNRIQIYVKENS